MKLSFREEAKAMEEAFQRTLSQQQSHHISRIIIIYRSWELLAVIT
jgi:hypothetical protein